LSELTPNQVGPGSQSVRRSRARIVCAALLALAVVAGCSSGGQHKPALHGELTIGVLAPLSGADAPLGRALVNGASLAVDEANDGSGLLGHRVRLAVQDDGCTPGPAMQAATRLVQANVVGVVGGVCNASTQAAVTALARAGTPTLVTTADADTLASTSRPSVFLVNGTVYQQGLAAVHWIAYRNAQRLAVVADSSPQAAELARVVVRDIDAPLVSRSSVRPGQALGPVATATLRPRPDFVYWAGSAQDGGRLLRELRGRGYRGRFMASSPSDNPAFLAAAGNQAAEGAFITTPARPDLLPGAAQWAARYRAKYQEEPGRPGMQAYDAIRALLQAVRRAGDTRGRSVSDNLARLRGFSTFLGELQFAQDHTMTYDNYVIATVHEGAITLASKLRTD
jgi:branched-chain amino acid transport system substrate-binding protein